jgi:hypothetical protein
MRKNVVRGFKMFDAANISATVTSAEVNVINLDKASIYVDWTGTSPAGVLSVEAKNSENGTWFELDFGTPIPVSGSPGEHVLIFNELPHNTIRLVYTRTSGTGAMNAVLVAKQVGG